MLAQQYDLVRKAVILLPLIFEKQRGTPLEILQNPWFLKVLGHWLQEAEVRMISWPRGASAVTPQPAVVDSGRGGSVLA